MAWQLIGIIEAGDDPEQQFRAVAPSLNDMSQVDAAIAAASALVKASVVAPFPIDPRIEIVGHLSGADGTVTMTLYQRLASPPGSMG